MTGYPCPYLGQSVELTEERAGHIAERHPDLWPEHRDCLPETLADPDTVRRSNRFANARLFTRWFEAVGGGKHAVVVVVSDPAPSARHWIITAYLARKLAEGDIEWQRS